MVVYQCLPPPPPLPFPLHIPLPYQERAAPSQVVVYQCLPHQRAALPLGFDEPHNRPASRAPYAVRRARPRLGVARREPRGPRARRGRGAHAPRAGRGLPRGRFSRRGCSGRSRPRRQAPPPSSY